MKSGRSLLCVLAAGAAVSAALLVPIASAVLHRGLAVQALVAAGIAVIGSGAMAAGLVGIARSDG